MKRLIVAACILLSCSLASSQTSQIIVRRAAAAGGCTEDFSTVTFWLNWDDDACTSDITTYTTDASNELSWDTTVSVLSGGNTVISDEAALGGSACGIYVNGASDSSFFRFDNMPNNDVNFHRTQGCIAVEFAQDGVTEPNNLEFVGHSPVTMGMYFRRASATTDDIFISYDGGAIYKALTTDTTSCDAFLDGDTATHVAQFCYDTDNGGSGLDYLRLYIDGTLCAEDTSANFIPFVWTGSGDFTVGPTANDVGTMKIDRVGASNDPAYDFNDVWITQGCVDYVAP